MTHLFCPYFVGILHRVLLRIRDPLGTPHQPHRLPLLVQPRHRNGGIRHELLVKILAACRAEVQPPLLHKHHVNDAHSGLPLPVNRRKGAVPYSAQ